MTEKKEIGNFGEEAAAEYLRGKGMSIIKQNFYCRAGEIDIIARDGEYTVFAEVKTRKNSRYGTAAEFVDYRKQERIIKTALVYVGAAEIAMRFDVVEVYYHMQGEKPVVDKINHIENAFC